MLCIGISNAQTISNVNPSIAMEGTTINVAISGQNSNFQQGTTTVWFNQGSSTIYASNVNVNNNKNNNINDSKTTKSINNPFAKKYCF